MAGEWSRVVSGVVLEKDSGTAKNCEWDRELRIQASNATTSLWQGLSSTESGIPKDYTANMPLLRPRHEVVAGRMPSLG
jgi:hypothetical protein